MKNLIEYRLKVIQQRSAGPEPGLPAGPPWRPMLLIFFFFCCLWLGISFLRVRCTWFQSNFLAVWSRRLAGSPSVSALFLVCVPHVPILVYTFFTALHLQHASQGTVYSRVWEQARRHTPKQITMKLKTGCLDCTKIACGGHISCNTFKVW